MIKSITFTNYLMETIKVNLREPEQTGFLILSISGLGPVKADINTTELATSDGALYNSSRLTKRNMILRLQFMRTSNKESIEDIRQKTYKYFPLKKPIIIIIETDNRTLFTQGYVESNEPDIFSKEEGSQISILCPDPYLYSSNEHTTEFSVNTPSFEFPFSNESLTENLLEFGTINNNTSAVISYNGDSEVGVTIYIHANGPAENISIYNLKTRESISILTTKIQDIFGEGLVAGDEIIISTKKGNKTATLQKAGEYYNILNCLDRGIDWFTLSKGDNPFAFTAESGAENLQFIIRNDIVYEGI